MKLPSKTTPYNNSVIAVFPKILALLKESEMNVSELYKALVEVDFGNFINALDCLYALGKIDLDTEGGVLCYVESNPM